MQKHFADRLVEAIKAKGNPICVGLDPRLDKIPEFIRKDAFEAAENEGRPLPPPPEEDVPQSQQLQKHLFD